MFGNKNTLSRGVSGAIAIWLVIITSIFTAGAAVASRSDAAFSALPSDIGDEPTSRSSSLSAGDANATAFQLAAMAPGDFESRCFEVTYSGTLEDPSDVRFYSGGFASTGDLADYLNVTIEQGSRKASPDCAGFIRDKTLVASTSLTAFSSAYSSYATGLNIWDPTDIEEIRAVKITITLDPSTPNTVQGDAVVGLTFLWELQGN